MVFAVQFKQKLDNVTSASQQTSVHIIPPPSGPSTREPPERSSARASRRCASLLGAARDCGYKMMKQNKDPLTRTVDPEELSKVYRYTGKES